jgi:hypothetical protein
MLPKIVTLAITLVVKAGKSKPYSTIQGMTPRASFEKVVTYYTRHLKQH